MQGGGRGGGGGQERKRTEGPLEKVAQDRYVWDGVVLGRGGRVVVCICVYGEWVVT